MVVLAVLLVLAGISLGSLINTNDKQALDKSTLAVTALLEQARGSTLASKNDSEYGVHFDADKAVMFKGTTYSSSNSSNISAPINYRVQISGVSLSGGGNEVIFQRLTGGTIYTGTITLSLVASSTQTKTITIYGTGVIDRN